MDAISEARAWMLAYAVPRPATQVDLADAAGRVLAEDVVLRALPLGPVAAITGHAVRAGDTEGASDYAPVPLRALEVIAGAPMPPGTDAVLPDLGHEGDTVALAAVAGGAHVIPAGHDAPQGVTLRAGAVVGPLHLALLAQAGVHRVPVLERPRVAIHVSSGDDGPVRLMLDALVQAEGGAADNDAPDLTLLVSDVPFRPPPPDSPFARGDLPCLTLPGDPVHCANAFVLVAAPAIRRMAGRPEPAALEAILTRKVSSPLGQSDVIRVDVQDGAATPLGPAETCGLLAASRANALLLIAENSEGYPSGAQIRLTPLSSAFAAGQGVGRRAGRAGP